MRRSQLTWLAETVADELPGLGDADIDRPFLDHNAGEPGRVRRGAHGFGGAEDGHNAGLDADIPVRDLPASWAAASPAEGCARWLRTNAATAASSRPAARGKVRMSATTH